MPTNQENCFLPQDILIQIFLFLPFESIQTCKLVSKEWKNLTDDPRFLQEYPSFAPFYFQNFVYCVTSTVSSRCNPPLAVNHIPIEWKHDEGITQLLSESSKGIACVVTNRHRLLFYNLFTGGSYPPTEVPGAKAGFVYGFGYDSYADDCKMMSVEEGNSLFWVYSLRNRAWKSFEGFPYAAYYWSNWVQSRSCSFNGVLHWAVAKRDQKPQNCVILTYDLHTSRFGDMLLPSDCYGYRTEVAELGGRLCYWTHTFTGFLVMVTMREYGVSESWTRFLSIDLTKLSHGPFRHKIKIEPSRFLYKCQSGRKLLLFVCKHYGTLYWYDIDNDKVTRIQKNTWEKRMNRKRKTLEFEGMQQHIWLGERV